VFARFRPCISTATVLVMLLVGCAGDAGSRSVAPGTAAGPALPLSASQRSAHPAVSRRTLSVPSCAGDPTGTHAFLGAGENNAVPGTDSVVVGGADNEVCVDYSSIVGGDDNAISTSGGYALYGFIGGGISNTITDSAVAAAIAGGHSNTISSSANNGFIGGGQSNTLSATQAVLAGGYNNSVTAEYGMIGAGEHNTVSGEGAYIAAGGYNTASGEGAVVDGGFSSTASGTFATIPGGYVNSAAGTYSFAAGARASAAQAGTFVWSDGSDGDTILTSTQAYQFLARASGGFTLYTNAGSTVGAQLAAGSGTWASLSDRNAKTAIVPLDDDGILAKVDALPISRWSYKSEHGVRHVGPMAQDFYAAFKVGEDDRHITSIDEDGVALAAIKALHSENARLRARYTAENATLRRQLATMASSQAVVQRELRRLTAKVEALTN
jgi:hypothetical protein